MGSMRPGGRFLPFSKNIQRTQKQPVPPSFPQSLSGSETDVSTSTENLSHEERYVIRHTARVEPQGQENQPDLACAPDHTSKETVSGSNRNSLKEGITGGGGGAGSNRSSLDVSASSYNTLIIHGAGDEPWTARLAGIRDHSSELGQSGQSPYHTLKRETSAPDKRQSGIPVAVGRAPGPAPAAAPPAPAYIDIGGQRIYTSPPDQGVQEITEIPDDFLNQSSVLKHLAREVAQSPPPPAPRGRAPRTRLAPDKLSLSRSQPDLSSVGWEAESACGAEGAEDDAFAAVLDELAAENQALKQQLSDACGRVAKTDKLEEEVEKVRLAHEELVRSCERRERLERAARTRLQADCRRLADDNRALRDQLALLAAAPTASSDTRDRLVAQLVAQNKELASWKERHEVEMAAQRATLQEQRTHIAILDGALGEAQAGAARLEDEARRAGGCAERVAALQRALAALQQASDRREVAERKLRAQLEAEVVALRTRTCACGASGGGSSEDEVRGLRAECAQWERRAREAAAAAGAAVPNAVLRDAHLAALEQSAAEAERLLAEARADRIRHMDDLHAALKRSAELEGRLKEAQSRLAERDAMVQVLQTHAHSTYDSSASLRNHSSREELVGFGASSSGASFSSAEGVGAAGGARYRHLRHYGAASSRSDNNNSGYESSSLRLEEQLAALDARLDSRAPSAVSHAAAARPHVAGYY